MISQNYHDIIRRPSLARRVDMIAGATSGFIRIRSTFSRITEHKSLGQDRLREIPTRRFDLF